MDTKKKRVRSPAYPAVSLKTALKKASEFYKVEGRNEAFQSVAVTHWGYSQSSGNGLQLTAALSSFGLLDASGSGKNRKVKLSHIALKILLDDREESEEKRRFIQSLAIKPKINQKLWNLWGSDLPSAASMKHHLIFEENFNEKSVGAFVKDYIETIEFAGLNTEVVTSSSDEQSEPEPYPNEQDTYPEARTSAPDKQDKPNIIGHSTMLGADEVEIGKFPVGNNCTIRVLSSGYASKKAIQALVSQLQLNLEIGVFDDDLG